MLRPACWRLIGRPCITMEPVVWKQAVAQIMFCILRSDAHVFLTVCLSVSRCLSFCLSVSLVVRLPLVSLIHSFFLAQMFHSK